MIPSLLGVGWLAAKAGMYVCIGTGLITAVQKFHDFEPAKKVKTNKKELAKGVDQNVITGEGARERVAKMRELHEAK